LKILIIEDDNTLGGLLAGQLRKAGHEVQVASEGQEGLRLAYETHPDLIILDIMMPGMDGWQVCQRLREMADVPILMLTAKGEQEDVIRGLQLGADDYVRKPFDLNELELRIEAILRRSGSGGAERSAGFSDATLAIDLERRLVLSRGQPVHLTPTEFRLLAYLVRHRDRTVPHAELLREVWGPQYTEDTANLSVYIRYLREKIEVTPGSPEYILTEWGMGYRFGRSRSGALVSQSTNGANLAQ
jgi:two-component system, OmpR family, response regulator ResD